MNPKTIKVRQSTTTTSVETLAIPSTAQHDHNQLRAEIRNDLERLFFLQARTAIEHGAHYGAAIILTAALQYLVSLAAGPDEDLGGQAVKTFCCRFMPTYDAEAVFHTLRCGLFHRGVPERSDRSHKGVTLDEDCAHHDPDGKQGVHEDTITIAVPCYLADLRMSLKALLEETHTDQNLCGNCRDTHARYRPVPWPSPSVR